MYVQGKCVQLLLILVLCLVSRVSGHGRLWEPPSRGSMWRRGYNTSININDNELSCGGFTVSDCFLLIAKKQFLQCYTYNSIL